MIAQRDVAGGGHRLFHEDKEIGFIRGETVVFTGFLNADEAALAGRVAYLALARHRREQRAWSPARSSEHLIMEHGPRLHVVAASGLQATLRPPSLLAGGDDNWGVELELTDHERFDFVAITRARVMWTAILDLGVGGRMRQFPRPGIAPASPADRYVISPRRSA